MQDPNCAGCQKVNRHPGDGYTCMAHHYHDPLCRTFACSLEESGGKAPLPRERRVVIAGAAQEAFWRVVAEMLPEAKTGDMDVGAIMEFSRACNKAVEIWARSNVREREVVSMFPVDEARREIEQQEQKRERRKSDLAEHNRYRYREQGRECSEIGPHKHNRDDGPQCEAKGQCQDVDGSGACAGSTDPLSIAWHVACPLCKAQPESTCIGVAKGDPDSALGRPVTVHNARVKAGARK